MLPEVMIGYTFVDNSFAAYRIEVIKNMIKIHIVIA
jgi:hypothetical protein